MGWVGNSLLKSNYKNMIIYNKDGKSVNLQGGRYADVTKSDTTVFQPSTFFVGTAGDLVIKNELGDTVTLQNIGNGSFVPAIAIQVLDATTATGIVRFY